jgi:rhamnose transport system ATP-binding protein
MLHFRAISKSFGAVRALDGVSFDVATGEAHALVGENGAGKSTLLKILAGIVQADAGEITWNDRPLVVKRPHDALDQGIGMVYQEMLCFPNLTVSGNIFAGRERQRYGLLREDEMRERTRALLRRLSLPIDPDALAETLSTAHRQLLQVARALAFECRILVLDEPTTALTGAETDHLFDVLRGLRGHGTTLVYVSHRLPEVLRLCDRITVLRDGRFVTTVDRNRAAQADVVRAMVGREIPLGDRSAKVPTCQRASENAAAVEVVGLSRGPHFTNVSLSVARGEIVGMFGLVGSGRSELLETIFGLHAPTSGELRVQGHRVWFRSARDAARAGLALVPEERQRQGLWGNLSICHNLVIPRHTKKRDVLVRPAREAVEAEALVREWQIKTPGLDAAPDQLSGGNQQKVVLAKWLATGPQVLLLDEPTKGVDVGAKFEIHEMIRREAAGGLAVLLVSSDLPEVLALADRIVVMRAGRIQGELHGDEATEEAVMHLATSDEVAA